jgi:hypothetical protein
MVLSKFWIFSKRMTIVEYYLCTHWNIKIFFIDEDSFIHTICVVQNVSECYISMGFCMLKNIHIRSAMLTLKLPSVLNTRMLPSRDVGRWVTKKQLSQTMLEVYLKSKRLPWLILWQQYKMQHNAIGMLHYLLAQHSFRNVQE